MKLVKHERGGSRSVFLHCEKIEPSSWIDDKPIGYRGNNCYATHLKSYPCSNPVTGQTTQCFDEGYISPTDIPVRKTGPVKDICSKVSKLPELKKLIEDTKNTDLEHGFEVCEFPDGELKGGKYCKGTACEIHIEDCEGRVAKGSVHSHPNETRETSGYHTMFSDSDFASSRSKSRSFQCIAFPEVPPNGDKWRIRCVDMNGLGEEVDKLQSSIMKYNESHSREDFEVSMKTHKRAISKKIMCELKVG